jgi:hypothetical protein
MFEQLFDTYRKTSESWLQMQQDMFRNAAQQWMTPSQNAANPATEWGRGFQKRFLELAVEVLNRHRESLDATYKSGIEMLQQLSRVSESKSAEEYRRGLEDLWRKWFESVKTQSESQFRNVQN